MKSPSNIIALIAIGVGLWWTWMGFIQPVYHALLGDSPPDVSFLFTMMPLISLPGILCCVFGCLVLRAKTKSNIKGMIGAMMVMLAIGVAEIERLVDWIGLDDPVPLSVSLVIGSIIAMMAFYFITRWILKQEQIPAVHIGEVIGKVPIFLLSLVVYFLVFSLVDAVSLELGVERELLWVAGRVLLPIGAAFLFYQVATGMVERLADKERASGKGQKSLTADEKG